MNEMIEIYKETDEGLPYSINPKMNILIKRVWAYIIVPLM